MYISSFSYNIKNKDLKSENEFFNFTEVKNYG